ncbi:aurora kinase B-like [Aethina tumida]|uniref:aurora kinase B-like n=1 Tax=Aethina tumida TaxID=116153 RepID=UPI00096B62C7|nr:aurora kinase B-like [Aethina tumida]
MSKDVEAEVKANMEMIEVPRGLEAETEKFVESVIKHDAYKNNEYKWGLGDFELGLRLGRGKFGKVYLAREKKTGFIVVLKSLTRKKLVEGSVENQTLREIEFQIQLKHPNILQLFAWFHDSHRIYLVLEYASEGELSKHLKNSPGGCFDERLSAQYTYQVADALNYYHQNNIVHGDVKLENLFLTVNNAVKLRKRMLSGGSLNYLARDIIEGMGYGNYVDYWSLGVLCYQFLVGMPPFESEIHMKTFSKTQHVELSFPTHVTDGAKDLITKLFVKPAHERITFSEVMEHFWINKNM